MLPYKLLFCIFDDIPIIASIFAPLPHLNNVINEDFAPIVVHNGVADIIVFVTQKRLDNSLLVLE